MSTRQNARMDSEPKYTSWGDYLANTTPEERLRWCARKAKVANRDRLMSGKPDTKVTAAEVLAILTTAQGRCHHCQSLAVEGRPSNPANGAPLPWAPVGRRIGSLDHVVGRAFGGANTSSNLVWACLWCNTWDSERRPGATDHGAIQA